MEGETYFQIQDYIPARLIERMTAIRVQVEVSEMHRLSPAPQGEDAELEFLEVRASGVLREVLVSGNVGSDSLWSS